jgi:hypothetical protein
MRHTVWVIVLAAAILLLCVGHSTAVGPDDGVYQVLQSHPTFGNLSYFVSVHQNDAFLPSGINIVIASLFGDTTWTYGLGRRTGATVQGTLYRPNGTVYGTFTGALTGTAINGSAVVSGVTFTLAGSKLF